MIMRIYETKQEAYNKALEVKRQYPDAEIDEGCMSFCGMENGALVERKYKTFEVGYERYDKIEGWMDCSVIIIYKE